MQSLLFTTQELQKLDFPADAANVCLDAMFMHEMLEQAQQYRGDSENYVSAFETVLSDSIASLKPEDIHTIVQKIFNENKLKTPLFNLQTSPMSLSKVKRVLENHFVDLIASIAEKPEFRAVVKSRLQELAKNHLTICL